MSRSNSTPDKKPANVTRRDFLKLGGGLAGLALGSTLLPKNLLTPNSVVKASSPLGDAARRDKVVAKQADAPPDAHFVATDGWISLPAAAAVPPYHPDDMAPAGLTTYIFGYRDVTGFTADQVYAQKMKAQLAAPLFVVPQETDFTLKLTNLGLQMRPDLIDAHTVHFHGFRNAIPIFDGEPHSSVGVPIIRDLTYFYRPHDPGTYMYHCHFEETEHVHMGMIGPCFVTPVQNNGTEVDGLGDPIPAGKYCYNDGVQPGEAGSTAYDREYVMLISEIWTESHWCDSHIQLPEWSDYAPEFYLINGRTYPDTLLPNGGGVDPATGDLLPPQDANGTYEHLRYQPMSSLVQANAGDRILLRIINLGFEVQSMQLSGIKMRVVGRDATLLQGRDGTDQSIVTGVVSIGPGESADVIFTAPPVTDMTRFLFHNRKYDRLNNGGYTGFGGQLTEVHVYPTGTLPAQTAPNT